VRVCARVRALLYFRGHIPIKNRATVQEPRLARVTSFHALRYFFAYRTAPISIKNRATVQEPRLARVTSFHALRYFFVYRTTPIPIKNHANDFSSIVVVCNILSDLLPIKNHATVQEPRLARVTGFTMLRFVAVKHCYFRWEAKKPY